MWTELLQSQAAPRIRYALLAMLTASYAFLPLRAFGQAPATVQAKGHLNNGSLIRSSNGLVFRPRAGGSFDLHSGAVLGNTTLIEHVPAVQPAAVTDIFPVRSVRGDDPFLRYAAPPILGQGNAYARTDKGTPPVTYSANGGIVNLPPPNTTMEAFADATLAFSIQAGGPNNGRFRVDASSSEIRVKAPKGDNTKREAATLCRDPLEYTGIQAGDIIEGSASFDRSAFGVTIEEDLATVGIMDEAGTDFPVGPGVFSPGPSGIDSPATADSGTPLVYRMWMSFTHEMAMPQIDLVTNSAFTFRDTNGSVLLDPQTYVRDLLLNPVTGLLHRLGDSWSLSGSGELELFTWEASAASAAESVQVEANTMQVAEVPEPAALLLLAVGGFCVPLRRGRRVIQTP